MIAYAETAACLRATDDCVCRNPPAACARSSSAISAIRRRASPVGRAAPAIGREQIGAADCLFLRKILSGIARAPRPYGRREIAAMLVGHTEGLPAELTRLSTTGLLHDCAPRSIEQWIESGCAAGLIAMSADQYHRLTVTPVGRAVMTGRVEEVRMLVPEAARSTVTRTWHRMPRRSRR